MIMYLSGLLSLKNVDELDLSEVNVLQAFPYMKKNSHEYIPRCKNFLMDSGAFTMMNSKSAKKKFNIKDYVKKYGSYIKEHDVENFIELDIDGVYGTDVYIDTLHELQDITGKNPIKVFHTWRGLDYYKELTKKEKIICIGGLVVGQIKQSDYELFTNLINIAHENGCKVHGLGVTDSVLLRRYNFDSVDSSRFTGTQRYGEFYKFDGHSILALRVKGEFTFKGDECDRWSLNNWLDYSKYLEQY